ncbi:unnamed protein product, partial [Effrenium voratum]
FPPKPHPDCHLLVTLNALLPALTDMPKDAAPAEQDDDDEKIQENSGVDANWTVEERQQVYARLHESGTPLGLPDVAFEAPAMVQDAYDACIQKSPGIQMMMDAILQAAKRMDPDNWQRFQQIPLLNVHMDDQAVHSNLFAQTEPSWRPLLQRPKKRKQSCFFLHMGTAPLTSSLADFLTKLGWLGVCVGPVKPPGNNEDLLQHVPIDPASAEDQKYIDALLSESGGLITKPATFPLAYVNVVFNANEDAQLLDPHDEDYEDQLARRQEAVTVEPAKQEPEEKRLQNAPLPAVPPGTTAGYGLVGLTRGERVRRRLRALRNSLNIALGRLAKDGTLVVIWPGLPVHPVLFFIAGSLRKLFQRVHVFSPEGSKTFEVYILAAGYSREKAESKVPGIGGLELRSFFDNTWRSEGLDDVLLWTLAPLEEDEETNVGLQGKGVIVGYTNLWKTWGTKLTSLALDLGMLLSQEDGMASPKRGSKKKKPAAKKAAAKKAAKDTLGKPSESAKPAEMAEGKPEEKLEEKSAEKAEEKSAEKAEEKAGQKAEEKPGEKAEEKPGEKAEEKPGEKSEEKPSVPHTEKEAPTQSQEQAKPGANADEASKPSPSQDPAEPKPEASPSARTAVAEDPEPGRPARKTKPGQAPRKVPFGARLQPVTRPAQEGNEKPRPRFVLKRAMPNLSCTLGAAPGHKFRHPDPEELAKEYPLIHKALEVARRGRQKHWDLKEDSAGRSQESLAQSPEAKGSGPAENVPEVQQEAQPEAQPEEQKAAA